MRLTFFFFFFFNDTATTEIYTLSLHDALPICLVRFESSSVPTTLPTAYDVYPLDGRHDGGYYTVKDCVTIDGIITTIMARSEERFSRNAETDLVCRLLLEKKKKNKILVETKLVSYLLVR